MAVPATWKWTDMRIESVSAEAFGPLAGESLRLARGMTVIVGRNESAKSSWHAAIYAGLCGRRRGPGVSNKDRQFADLHKPWDSDAWLVEVTVVLDDGRTIQLRQDLAGRVDSRATDIVLARDVSDEIMNAGAPDGAKWLGLDRDSFLATACINQAALLEVLESASALQECLGRAAASARADVPASRALELIENFRKEQVGGLGANANRPLKRAHDRLALVQTERESAGRAHEDYVALVMTAEQARTTADEAARRVEEAIQREQAVEAFVAASRAADRTAEETARCRARRNESARVLEEQKSLLDRVVQLDVEFTGQPPAGLAETEDAAGAVKNALALWAAAPTIEPLEGETAEQLRTAVAQLPEPPSGDTEADPAVMQAHADLAAARRRLATHNDRRPEASDVEPDPELAAAIAATPAVVRSLADDVAAADGMAPLSSEAIARLGEVATAARRLADRLRSDAQEAATRGSTVLKPRRPMVSVVGWIAATVLVLAAVAAFAVGQTVAGVAAAGVAVMAGVIGIVGGRRSSLSVPSDSSDPTDRVYSDQWGAASDAERKAIKAEEAYGSATRNASAHASVRADAEARCAGRGLPADAQRLRQLAEAVEAWREQHADLDRWTSEKSDVGGSVVTLESRVRSVLLDRGVGSGDPQRPVDDIIEEYRAGCQQRSSQAAAASRRAVLEERIHQRVIAEEQYARATQLRRAASDAVVTAAATVGLTETKPGDGDPMHLASSLQPRLETWQRERLAKAGELDEAHTRWRKLQALLDGSTIAQLSKRLAEAVQAQESVVSDLIGLERAAVEAESLRIECAQIAGLLPGLVPDVPVAQQALESARRALGEVRASAQSADTAATQAEAVRSERGAGLLS
ncbi:MAG: AAA family ATPase, partial [Actinobacteria bacterium]|nr:AAA family ATPase [Actinomycetota bacterium]